MTSSVNYDEPSTTFKVEVPPSFKAIKSDMLTEFLDLLSAEGVELGVGAMFHYRTGEPNCILGHAAVRLLGAGAVQTCWGVFMTSKPYVELSQGFLGELDQCSCLSCGSVFRRIHHTFPYAESWLPVTSQPCMLRYT